MITFAEYRKLGYELMPEGGEFTRYMAKAWLTANKYAFNRINAKKMSEYNLRGICELAELYYCDEKQINKPVLSFQNEGYGETYGLPGNTNTQTIEEKAYGIMQIYFTKEQLFRGVN